MNKSMSKRRSHLDSDKLVMKRLTELRKLYKMSQSYLAKQLDITVQQLYKYEQCQNSVSIGRLAQIADKMKVDIGYFIQDLNKDTVVGDEILDINAPFITIKSSKQQEAIRDLIVSLASPNYKNL